MPAQPRVSWIRANRINGFTLAELLTVLAVLGLLTLPLLALTSKNRLAVQQIQCTANLRQLTRCSLLYCSDSGSVLWYAHPGFPWMRDLNAYSAQLNQIIVCPSALPRVPTPVQNYAGAADAAWAWAADVPTIFGSYGLNGWMYYDEDYARGLEHLFQKQSAIAFPSQTPVFLDCVWDDLWPLETDPTPANLYLAGGDFTPPEIGRACIPRHGGFDPALAPTNYVGGVLPGAINMGLADGHVETVRLEKLWCYYWHLNWSPALVPFPHPPPAQ